MRCFATYNLLDQDLDAWTMPYYGDACFPPPICEGIEERPYTDQTLFSTIDPAIIGYWFQVPIPPIYQIRAHAWTSTDWVIRAWSNIYSAEPVLRGTLTPTSPTLDVTEWPDEWWQLCMHATGETDLYVNWD